MSTTSVQVVTLSLMSFAAVGVHSSIAFSLSVPQLTGCSFVSRETYLAGNHDIKSSCGIREKRRKSRDRVRLTASLSSAPSLPRDVKDAVTKCRTAVQTALGDRLSRMDIEMPVGAKFGVEKSGKNKKKALLGGSDSSMATEVSKDMLDTSDRELCRLFVEMFQPVGGENIAAVFNDENYANIAKSKWKGDYGADCRIMSISRGKGSSLGMGAGKKKKKKSMGFAAKMAAELNPESSGPFSLPNNIEVAIFVAPSPKELVAIERICNEVGMGTCVILLNARLGKYDGKFPTEDSAVLFSEEFVPVFHLGAAPQEAAPECLVFRSYPDDWTLARKPKVGPPKVISSSPERFSIEECQEAYDTIEIGDLEEKVEDFMGNLAGWFK